MFYLTLKQINILTEGKKEEKNKDKVYKETTITITKKIDCLLVLPPPSIYLSLALPVAVYIKFFL